MYPIVETIYQSSQVCQHQWKIEDAIGTDGTYGEVWLGCCQQDCNYAIKYMPYNDGIRYNKKEDIIAEINTHQLCAQKGLCPYIYDAWLSPTGGTMVMQLYDVTVRQLLLKYKDYETQAKILANIITLVDKLHQYGIYHGDLHLDNIMVNIINNSDKYIDINYHYYFIDFGKGGTFSDMASRHRYDDYMEIAAHIQDLIDEHPDYNFDKLYETMKIYFKKFDQTIGL